MMTDIELIRLAAEFRKGILGRKSSRGMCFAVAAPLSSFLSFGGVSNSLEKGENEATNHFYIRLSDGRVLDPTADQFGFDPVYLGSTPVLELLK